MYIATVKLFLLASIAIGLSVSHVQHAHAIASPAPTIEVVPPSGSQVSPRAHILICLSKASTTTMAALAKSVVANIDGKPVASSSATSFVGAYYLLDIWIDSSRTGQLTIAYGVDNLRQQATYRVAGNVTPRIPSGWWWMPRAQVAGTVDIRATSVPHSTVREVYQGVLLTIAQPALSMRVSWRRDSQSDWLTLRLPVVEHASKKYGVLLGENYQFQFPSIALLNAGVQIRATAELLDGNIVDVVGLPPVVTLPLDQTIAPTR